MNSSTPRNPAHEDGGDAVHVPPEPTADPQPAVTPPNQNKATGAGGDAVHARVEQPADKKYPAPVQLIVGLVVLGVVVGFGWSLSTQSGITAAVLGLLLGLGGKSLFDEFRDKGDWHAESVRQIGTMLLTISGGVIVGLAIGFAIRGDLSSKNSDKADSKVVKQLDGLTTQLDNLKAKIESGGRRFTLHGARQLINDANELATRANELSRETAAPHQPVLKRFANALLDGQPTEAQLKAVRQSVQALLVSRKKGNTNNVPSKDALEDFQKRLDALFPETK